ncbi:MAG TPA: hypothetical protein VGV89_04580 [Thermoplasmata archaeon]|nr:hypothetical protein [Thermoplasmata archaeon]
MTGASPIVRRTALAGGTVSDLGRLSELAARQGRIASALVRTEEIPVEELEAEIAGLERCLLGDHLEGAEETGDGSRPRSGRPSRSLERDHEIFATSVGELRGLLEIVRRDPHGGNRQALGQYWKIVLEALDRHLREERVLLHWAPLSAAVDPDPLTPPVG